MGEAAPPIFDARAMPRIKALEKLESAGRLRRIGFGNEMSMSLMKVKGYWLTWMMEKQRTGAATLLIHMLATRATNIFVISTVRGRVPALLSTNVAISFAMEYFDKAAAMVKPPSNSIITGVHMAEKTYWVALFVSSRRCVSSDRTTCSTTAKNGTSNAVTNSGMT